MKKEKMETKVEATFFFAFNKLNEIMEQLNLRNRGKFYTSPIEVSYITTTKVNDKYFMKLIYDSFKDKECKIVAIMVKDIFYKHESVTQISDGKHEFFVPHV